MRAAALWRDPLVGFAVIGSLLFGLDAWLRPAPAEEIMVPSDLGAAQREQFIREQIMVREARRRGLDQGDSIINRQLQQSLRALIEAQVNAQVPSDAVLHAWLAQSPERYAAAERFDFQHQLFRRSDCGKQCPELATRQLASLRQGDAPNDTPDARLQQVDHADLRRRYGAALADAAVALQIDQGWVGPLASGLGWHLLRLERRHPAPPPDFAALRPRLAVDWLQAQRDQAFAAEIERLRNHYRIREPGDDQ